MRLEHWILGDNDEPKKAGLIEWMMWFESANRLVRGDVIGDFRISTVFLGIDHGYGDEPPVLWETMIFHKGIGSRSEHPLHDWQERYSSKRAALDGHHRAVELVLAATQGER